VHPAHYGFLTIMCYTNPRTQPSQLCTRVLTERIGGRQSHLLTAEVVRGMCPDMCPEKERYMREDRRRLSVYEMVPGTDLVHGVI